MKRKPDLLLVLATLFAIGLVVSGYTHGQRSSSEEANQKISALTPITVQR